MADSRLQQQQGPVQFLTRCKECCELRNRRSIRANWSIGKLGNFDFSTFAGDSQETKSGEEGKLKREEERGTGRQCWTPWQATPPLPCRPPRERWQGQRAVSWYSGERHPDEDHPEEPVDRLLGGDQSARQRPHSQALGGHKVGTVKISLGWTATYPPVITLFSFSLFFFF